MSAAAVAESPGVSKPDTVQIVPLKLFVSYAHEDEPFRAELEKNLIVLKIQGVIDH